MFFLILVVNLRSQVITGWDQGCLGMVIGEVRIPGVPGAGGGFGEFSCFDTKVGVVVGGQVCSSSW